MNSSSPLAVRLAIVASALFTAVAANAQANLVTNGGFEEGTGGFYNDFVQVASFNDFMPTGWLPSSSAYGNLVVAAKGYPYSNDFGGVGLAQDFPMITPDGGNFVMSDTDRSLAPDYSGEISQWITGLTPGQNYTLTFYQASSGKYQPKGADVQTTQWDVTFGDSTQSSPLMTTAYNTSTPWQQVTMNFTATQGAQLLSFFGNGGPQGTPVIMATLDGVSLTAAVPEPSTFTMALAGFGVLAFMATRRRRKF